VSNANFTGGQVNSSANVYVGAANVYVLTTGSSTVEGNAYFYSNTTQQVLGVVSNSISYGVNVNVNAGFIVSGNSTFNNRVDVTGITVLANTLSVIGATTLSNTLTLTGFANLQSYANVGGSLSVNGSATFANALNVTGGAVLSNTLSVTGNVIFSNTLNVTGIATFGTTQTTNANVANLVTSTIDIGNGRTTGNSTGLYATYFSGTIGPSSNGFFANASQISIGNTSVNTTITADSVLSNTGTFFNLNVTGVLIGTFSATGNIIPSPNNTLFIGSSTNTFNQIFVTNTYTNSISSYSGTLNIVSNTNVNGFISINSNNHMTSGRYAFANGSQAAIDTFSTTTYRSGEYIIQMVDTGTSSFHVTKIVVYHDGTTAYSSEFAQMFNNSSLGTIVTDVNSGNVRILVTPATSSVVAKFSRNLLTV
jgi:hypothetical protein